MMNYYIVDAFTDKPFGGNQAGVVLLDSDTFPKDELMIDIAAELRYSETAFVRHDGEKEFSIRYFTPKAEVDLCGHATIASFFLLNRKGQASGQCICHTKAGDLQIEAGTKVMMQMAKTRIVATLNNTGEIYKALGANDYGHAMPVQVVCSGLPDIMVPLPDVTTLNRLVPDMDAIKAITQKHDAVSFHVFALPSQAIEHSHNQIITAFVRDFAPLYDIPEESATGTANASLTYYLQQCGHIPAEARCTFLQGEAMGRPSVIATHILPDGNIFVGGTAAIVAEGKITV